MAVGEATWSDYSRRGVFFPVKQMCFEGRLRGKVAVTVAGQYLRLKSSETD